jgi:hypothetical protein
MKFSKSISMIPLVLSMSSNAFSSEKTNFVFNEDDLEKQFIHVSQDLINESKRDELFSPDRSYITLRLRGFIVNWQKETKFASNISAMVQNANFKNILSLGKPAVPIILQEINKNPSNLVWALNYIEGFNISRSPISIGDACRMWIKWGHNRGLIN